MDYRSRQDAQVAKQAREQIAYCEARLNASAAEDEWTVQPVATEDDLWTINPTTPPEGTAT